MNNLFSTVAAWVAQNPSWTDAILAAGILIQGELAILLGTYLAVSGSITWTQFFLSTLPALVVGETVVYFAGRMLRSSRFGWKFYRKKKEDKRFQFYAYQLKQNMRKLFMIAKFIPATNFLIIFLTGWTRTKFREFLKAYIQSMLFWFAAITAISYFLTSGLHYLKTQQVFREAEIGILAIFLLIFGGEYLMRKFFGKYAKTEEKVKAIGDALEKEFEEKTGFLEK